jgi:hypothetical protein
MSAIAVSSTPRVHEVRAREAIGVVMPDNQTNE